MKAAYDTNYDAAHDVLKVGKLPDPMPGASEVRVAVRYCGIPATTLAVLRQDCCIGTYVSCGAAITAVQLPCAAAGECGTKSGPRGRSRTPGRRRLKG
jgi:hypothetical protein